MAYLYCNIPCLISEVLQVTAVHKPHQSALVVYEEHCFVTEHGKKIPNATIKCAFKDKTQAEKVETGAKNRLQKSFFSRNPF